MTYLKKIIERIIRFCNEASDEKQKEMEKGLDDYYEKKIGIGGLIKALFLPNKQTLIMILGICSSLMLLVVVVNFLKSLDWNIIILNILTFLVLIWLIYQAYADSQARKQASIYKQIQDQWLFYAVKIIIPALANLSWIEKSVLYPENLIYPNYDNSQRAYYYYLPLKFHESVRRTQQEMESLLYRSIRREFAKYFHLRTTDINITVTLLGDCFCLELH